MPELPEVETLRRSLAACLEGQVIAGVQIIQPSVLLPDSRDYALILPGQAIVGFGRRGKYLILELSHGQQLVIHLRMTGRLLWYVQGATPALHTHVVLDFQSGGQLHFQDVRRFGRWWLTEGRELEGIPGLTGLASLGPEPIDEDFSGQVLARRLSRRSKAKIKNALLDQQLVAGLGNIYVDEALFIAGIHPLRPAGSLTAGELEGLAAACRQVLLTGIVNRGTSFRDYVDALDQMGDNQKYLQVYQREGEPCRRCGSELRRIKVGGRSSFFCADCQKESLPF